MTSKIKLGELLLQVKLLEETQLQAALAEQKKWGGRLGDILVRMKFIEEDALMKALSTQLGIPLVNLDALQSVPENVLSRLPLAVAQKHRAVPLQVSEDKRQMVVAMEEPQNLRAVDELAKVTQWRISPCLAKSAAISRAIERFYRAEFQAGAVKASSPPTVLDSSAPLELLQRIEEAQLQEVATLKGLVEMLIEKGIFSRDEYLAKMKRSGR